MIETQPFYSKMGMELTWLHWTKRNEDTYAYGYSNLLKGFFRDRGIPFYRIYNDASALEVATPPFSNLGEVKAYYSRLMPEISRLSLFTGKPLVTHRSDTVSGGGHIHVAIPSSIKKDRTLLLVFLINVFRDITNRPYLNWVFNDYGNIQSARSLVEWKVKRTLYGAHGFDLATSPTFERLIFDKNPKVPRDFKTSDILDVFDITKGYAIKVSDKQSYERIKKPETLEFRFFDTKRNFEEIECHLEFVDKYLRHIEKISRRGKMIPLKICSLEDIKGMAQKDRGVSQFRDLLAQIGLDYARYQPFIRLNYLPRKRAKLLK
jgi:hypothetical protein